MLFQGVSMKNKTSRGPAVPQAENINSFIILRSDLLLLTTEGLKYMLRSVTHSIQVKDIILCNSTKHTCWYWHLLTEGHLSIGFMSCLDGCNGLFGSVLSFLYFQSTPAPPRGGEMFAPYWGWTFILLLFM